LPQGRPRAPGRARPRPRGGLRVHRPRLPVSPRALRPALPPHVGAAQPGRQPRSHPPSRRGGGCHGRGREAGGPLRRGPGRPRPAVARRRPATRDVWGQRDDGGRRHRDRGPHRVGGCAQRGRGDRRRGDRGGGRGARVRGRSRRRSHRRVAGRAQEPRRASAPFAAARGAGGAHRGDADRAPRHPEPARGGRELVSRFRAASGPRAPRPPMSAQRRRRVLLGLGVALPVVMLVAVSAGSVPLPLSGVLASLMHAIGVGAGPALSPSSETILWVVRLPRVLLAAVVGGGLAVVGATLQSVFRNPLPGSRLLGVGAGAALGAVAAVRLGWAGTSFLALPFAAFAGAMVAVLLLYTLSQSLGGGTLHGLLLTGISVSALAAAGTSMLLVATEEFRVK